MSAALSLSRAIDRLTEIIGKAVIWLIFAAIIVSAGNAISRKLFSLSSNAWLELQWYLFGAVFMLAAAYTLQPERAHPHRHRLRRVLAKARSTGSTFSATSSS